VKLVFGQILDNLITIEHHLEAHEKYHVSYLRNVVSQPSPSMFHASFSNKETTGATMLLPFKKILKNMPYYNI
jgi:hypothetical protein